MKKITRTFWGAAIGAFMSIWPAATLELAWLVVPGAFVGWLFSYHGDRFWRGLKRSIINVRKDISTYPEQAKQFVLSLGRGVSATGQGLFTALVWLFTNLLGITLLLRGIKWLKAHPVNLASTITLSMNILGFVSLLGLASFVMFTGAKHFEHSDLYGAFAGFFFLILFVSGVWNLFTLSFNDTYKSFYGRWDRYNRFKLLFPVVELLRYVYVLVWVQVVTWGLFFGIVFIAAFAAVYYCTATVLFGLIRHTIHFAWRAAKYNSDYGLMSLFTATLTGLVVYHNYENQLVSDPVIRLAISVVAALTAGCVAALVTHLVPIWFKRSYTTRQLYTHKGDVTSWLLDRTTVNNLIEKKVKPMWKVTKEKIDSVMDWFSPSYALGEEALP